MVLMPLQSCIMDRYPITIFASSSTELNDSHIFVVSEKLFKDIPHHHSSDSYLRTHLKE